MSPLELGEALEVIDEVGYADLDGGSGDLNSAYFQPHAKLLSGKHVLDLSADFGSPGIGLGDMFRHRPPRLAFLVDVAGEHSAREERLAVLPPVSGVRPDTRTGVPFAVQGRQGWLGSRYSSK